MGKMVNGEWTTEWYKADQDGRFVRPDTVFRDRIGPDCLDGGLHLYVSYACPWANRVLIVRAWHDLEEMLPISVVHPYMGDEGWCFDASRVGATQDKVLAKNCLHQVYSAGAPTYTGRVTVPVLWNLSENRIVNNESREIIEMLDEHGAKRSGKPPLWPASLRTEIDAMIDANYETVNNAVYRAGFATSQQAYEQAATALFKRLDELNEHLADRRFLCGQHFTTADVCLFTTLMRFDTVYVGHFKCNLRRLVDFEHLWAYTRDVFQMNLGEPHLYLQHSKEHYYRSHLTINPTGLVPVGPALDFDAPHDRLRFS